MERLSAASPLVGLSCLRIRQVHQLWEHQLGLSPCGAECMMGLVHVGKDMMATDQEALEEFGAFVQRGENAIGTYLALFL